MMKTYESRVRKLEREGLTRSDAQGVVDAQDMAPATRSVSLWQVSGIVGEYFTTKMRADVRALQAFPGESDTERHGRVNYVIFTKGG